MIMRSFEDITNSENIKIQLISDFLLDHTRDGKELTINLEIGLTDQRLKLYAGGDPLKIEEANFVDNPQTLK